MKLILLLVSLFGLKVIFSDNRRINSSRKIVVSAIRERDCKVDYSGANSSSRAATWFQSYWEPCVACVDEERIGPIGDGGKWICNPVQEFEKNKCLVISVGSYNDFRFEYDIVRRFGCVVHVFDHTSNPPRRKGHQFNNIFFHPVGLGVQNSTNILDLRSMINFSIEKSQFVANFNQVDLLKIDCEGCEISALTSPVGIGTLRDLVIQLDIEVHHNTFATVAEHH